MTDSDDIISVTSGAPPVDIEPGTYTVTLTDISKPRPIYPQSGPNAGKEVMLRDWTFTLDDDRQITGSASTASGPKSKTFAWLTALLGHPPVVGQDYPRSQLVGRLVLATIILDDAGYPRVQQLTMLPKTAPRTAPAPAARPGPAQPVAPASDLPF